MTLAASSDAGSTALGVVIWIIAFIAYWVPTIIALARRGAANTGSIVVLNVFGFLFVPWLIALVMACRSKPQPQQTVVYTGFQPPPTMQPPSARQYPPPPAPGYGQQQQPPWDQQG